VKLLTIPETALVVLVSLLCCTLATAPIAWGEEPRRAANICPEIAALLQAVTDRPVEHRILLEREAGLSVCIDGTSVPFFDKAPLCAAYIPSDEAMPDLTDVIETTRFLLQGQGARHVWAQNGLHSIRRFYVRGNLHCQLIMEANHYGEGSIQVALICQEVDAERQAAWQSLPAIDEDGISEVRQNPLGMRPIGVA